MNPKDVKLAWKVRWNILIDVLADDNDLIVYILMVIASLCGIGMAMCVPSFMTGAISNFIMKLILSILFAVIFMGIPALALKFWEEDLEPVVKNLTTAYNAKLLPLQKAEIEKVDDILLK